MIITTDTLIADVIKAKPNAGPVFMNMGMHCLGCAMAHNETVGEAASVHGIDANALVEQLNALEA